MDLPLVGGAYKAASVNNNAQTCINLYPERDTFAGKYPAALYGTPGLTLFSFTQGNSVRAMYEMNDTLYFVIDNQFYTMEASAVPVSRGHIATGVGPVSIFSNDNNQVWIVDGLKGYVYNFLDKEFNVIDDEHFIAPVISTYQDRFGIYLQPNTDIWWLTDIDDFTKIDPLDFFSLSGTPDKLVSLTSSHQELWLFSRQSAEVWYNTGAADTFFERRQGLLVEYGTESPYSVTKSTNGVISWLARNTKGACQFISAKGFVPEVISTSPIERIISSYDRIYDVTSYTYRTRGHEFSVWNFPHADATWVYDHVEKEWHQRTSTINNTPPCVLETRQGRHRGNCYAFAFGHHLVGDAFSGTIYILDENNYTDNGMYIARERACPHAADDLNLINVTNLELDAETGVGLATGQGQNPQIMFDLSKDNGHSFGTELWRSMGVIGEPATRIKWSRMGKSRDWVPRFRITDPVKVVLLALRADLTAGVAHRHAKERLRLKNLGR